MTSMRRIFANTSVRRAMYWPSSLMAPGRDFAPLQSKYVGCLVSRGTVRLSPADGGPAVDSDSYELNADVSCRNRLPQFGQNVLIVQAGKIMHLLPKSAFTTIPVLEDGGRVPTP